MSSIPIRIALTSLAAAMTLCTAGCLISTERSVHTQGREISPRAMDAIQPGVTTEAELLQHLGTPSRTMAADDGGTIYVWSWTREERGEGRALFLFSGEHETSSEASASALVRNGLVQQWWTDAAANG